MDLEELKLHSLLGYFFAGVWLCSSHLKKSRTRKGDMKFRAGYPRTFGTIVPNKILYKLPYRNSTIFISQFQRTSLLSDPRYYISCMQPVLCRHHHHLTGRTGLVPTVTTASYVTDPRNQTIVTWLSPRAP
jgi:hypothetical protein